MKGSIRAKPTVYQGVEFRSRLEARWAVFFDACGISWNYEPRWIELDEGPYLPDFILPELRLVVEVKPGFQKEALVRLGKSVYVLNDNGEAAIQDCFYGLLLTRDDLTVPSKYSGNKGPWRAYASEHEDDEAYEPYQWWCECDACGKVGAEDDGWGFMVCPHHSNWDMENTTEATPKLRSAYQASIRAFTRAR